MKKDKGQKVEEEAEAEAGKSPKAKGSEWVNDRQESPCPRTPGEVPASKNNKPDMITLKDTLKVKQSNKPPPSSGQSIITSAQGRLRPPSAAKDPKRRSLGMKTVSRHDLSTHDAAGEQASEPESNLDKMK